MSSINEDKRTGLLQKIKFSIRNVYNKNKYYSHILYVLLRIQWSIVNNPIKKKRLIKIKISYLYKNLAFLMRNVLKEFSQLKNNHVALWRKWSNIIVVVCISNIFVILQFILTTQLHPIYVYFYFYNCIYIWK